MMRDPSMSHENQGSSTASRLPQADQHELRQPVSGKLTIFLGYAPGVGKTYAMLEAVRQRRAEGFDVVVLSLDTHGNADTEALLAGLEVAPRLQGGYRGAALGEIEIEPMLARHPQLAVVDELAYANPEGGRHPQRYQDVEELLGIGIDVYTTLNIGELESLHDVVAQITGERSSTTVPDRVLENAHEIQVVDLLPADLLRRLSEGKVHVAGAGEPGAPARQFFREGNLIALRELTLRRTADRLDDQMRDYMARRAIPGPWPTRERLLVCVSPSPLGERLVRSARRMADDLSAAWFAVYVETPDQRQPSPEERAQVARTLALAEELGGKAFVIPGSSVTTAVLGYARAHNVTKIIAGKPLQPRWRELLRGSVVDQLIRHGVFDVYVVSSSDQAELAAPPARFNPVRWQRYLLSVGVMAGATLLSLCLHSRLHISNLLMIYLFAEIIAALALGRGPAILASALGALAFDFFIVPPRFTLAVDDTEYLLTFLGLFLVGVLISSLTSRFRLQAELAERRAGETATLNELSRDLAAAGSLDAIMDAIIRNIGKVFGREVAVLLPAAVEHDWPDTARSGQPSQRSEAYRPPRSPDRSDSVRSSRSPDRSDLARSGRSVRSHQLVSWAHSAGFRFDEREQAVARWAFDHSQPAGRGTDTLASAEARYLPLKTARSTVGVLGVKPIDPATSLTPDQRRLLEALASLAALAVERAQLAEETERARLQVESERVRNSLLSSVSHDLRTPLAGITGAASSLLVDGPSLDPATSQELTQSIYDEATRLNVLVGNLLDMTRLESGGIQVNKAWQPLEEVVGAALTHVEAQLADRPVAVRLDPDLPLVPLDEVSIQQVLVNLLENAVKYTPSGSPIELAAWAGESKVTVEVADRGPGLPAGDEERIFEKFYRAEKSAGGVGLGLAICRGIVEAHGGRIWAENRPGGGAAFRFELPIEGEPPRLPQEPDDDGALELSDALGPQFLA